MTERSVTGPRGGRRSPEGRRIEWYSQRKSWSLGRLAKEMGIHPTFLTHLLSGVDPITPEMRLRFVKKLDNCTVADLLDDSLLTKWEGVQNRFGYTVSCRVDKPWQFFDNNPEWPMLLPEACLPKAMDCFAVLLNDISGFTISADSTGISSLLAESVIFIERACLKQIPNARRLLFDVCDRLVQCYSCTLFAPALKSKVEPYLDKMRRVVRETHDPELSKRLRIREGDVLKLYGTHDASAFARAADVLGQGLGSGAGQDPFRLEAEPVRNLLLAGARTAKTKREFNGLIRMGEQSLDHGLTLEGNRHVLHGLGVGCAHYSCRTEDDFYSQKALEYHERAMLLGMPPEPTEISLRLERAILEYADYGIPDLVRSDGTDVDELERHTRLARSGRVAHETGLLVAKLKRKNIIKS